MVTTITTKGQITIPLPLRKLLSLNPADRLVFTVQNEALVAKPLKGDFWSLKGSVKPKSKPENFKKARETAKGYVVKNYIEKERPS